MRILLVTGKGGVGKTTVAAATGLAAAARGHRTLVSSTDPAHSLGDALDCAVDGEPTAVATGLEAQQLNARDRLEDSWEDIRAYLVAVMDWAGVAGIEAEELAVLPGLDEIFALADLRDQADSGRYDLIVVDCAPTAETIRLLSLPDVLAWYMDRAFPVTRRLNKVVAPVVSRLSSLPVASDDVFLAAERFYDRIDGVRELLRDGEVTSARLVVNPERMVVAEARRTFTYLSMFGYEVDAVVANRLLPDDITDPWFDRWRDVQAQQQDEIRDAFAPVPVLGAPMADDELLGPAALTRFGEELYEGSDPTRHHHRGRPLRIEDDGAAVSLLLDLPFAAPGDVDIARRGDELLVTLGPYRRPVALPDALRRRRVLGADFASGTLTVTFAEPDHDT